MASPREVRPCVTLEATLTQGRYLVLPLSLRPRSGRHAKPLPYVLRIGSAKPILCEATAASGDDVRACLAAYCRRAGEYHFAFDGMATYAVHDSAGWLTFAENTTSMMRFSINLDHEGSFNVLPSRGSLSTYDVLLPGQGMLLQALSIALNEDGSRMQCKFQFRSDMTSAEVHSPDAHSIHLPIQIVRRSGGGNFYSTGGMEIGLHDLLSQLGVRFIR